MEKDGSLVLQKDFSELKNSQEAFKKDLYLKEAKKKIQLHTFQSKCSKEREVRSLEVGRSLSKV